MKKFGILAKAAGASQRDFNFLVKQALIEAGVYWIKNFLPLHFKPGASQRYQYQARSARTKRAKATALKTGKIYAGANTLGGGRKGLVPIPEGFGVDVPLVWTGIFRDFLLAKDPLTFGNPFNWATATSNTQRVRIPVRYRHAIRTELASEPVRLNNAELRQMQKIALAELTALMRTLGVRSRSEEVIAA